MQAKALSALTFCACLLLNGCEVETKPSPEVQKQGEKLMQMTTPERQKALAQMTPEEQLNVYLYGQRHEPPMNSDVLIAPNWKALLPVVKVRLVAEHDEPKIAYMIALLKVISNTQCSLAARKDLADVASKAMNRVDSSPYDRDIGGDFYSMLHPVKPLPACEL